MRLCWLASKVNCQVVTLTRTTALSCARGVGTYLSHPSYAYGVTVIVTA